MSSQLTNILKHNRTRPMILYYARYFKKHSTPYIIKPFHLAHNTESLARETAQKQVMCRNVSRIYLGNIPGRPFTEIRMICSGCGFIPF